MESSGRRRNIPLWPPFKRTYHNLGSTEDFHLTPLPSTGRGPPSDNPSARLFSPGLDSSTAYTPDYIAATPNPYSPALLSSVKPAKKRWIGRGWQASSKIALTCAILVLVTNIGLTLGIVGAGHTMQDGVYMVYKGSCREIETKDAWIHLALNFVATVLLASSNYCMQLLSSPTRSEVDRAHSKQKWLDIGIPSLRNLTSLSKKKVTLWWILGLSSVPLHLVYNSVFYSALATNNYNILYASEGFVNGDAYNKELFPDDEDRNVTDIQARIAVDFESLTNEQCIARYAKDFVEDRRNVIVIVKDPPANQGSLFKVASQEFPVEFTTEYNAFAWICDDPNVVNVTKACCENEYGFVPCSKITPKLIDIADQWTTGGFEVDHCLSEMVESDCHLHFSWVLMTVVLGFNLLKVLGIAYVAFYLGESPLVTIGDAIQSFIRHPDRTSEGMCLASHSSITASTKLGYTTTSMRYEPRQQRFFEAATWRQLAFVLGLFTFAGVGTFVCLILGINALKGDKTIDSPWSIGLGNVKPQNLVMGFNLPGYGNTSIAISTLIANTPQALFSFLYICYNSLFTVMFLSRELMTFSVTTGRGRKYIRVSNPQGEQKCTYFLNLPYKYALPLLGGSGLTHWLVSQSVFLANISIIPRDGDVPMQDEITTVAYTPLAMLLLLILAIVILGFLVATAWRKLPYGMPLIASNSIALSAACHIPGYTQAERDQAVLRPLSWGVVPSSGKPGDLGIRGLSTSPDMGDDGGTAIQHCCFSDRPLEAPLLGNLYS
ncbi:hypothetical protein B0A52_02029 [Exophiala mesophila]|uniref:DUF6536 domain-containing protein n=1 Tax=Exophiala mesophila TaxID=212818 RepID=A0A438NEP4_EXOME|nr:hypothetical protein B0A52_02029 [Exophiala mesophila]